MAAFIVLSLSRSPSRRRRKSVANAVWGPAGNFGVVDSFVFEVTATHSEYLPRESNHCDNSRISFSSVARRRARSDGEL
jgi:hypothetical protein